MYFCAPPLRCVFSYVRGPFLFFSFTVLWGSFGILPIAVKVLGVLFYSTREVAGLDLLELRRNASENVYISNITSLSGLACDLLSKSHAIFEVLFFTFEKTHHASLPYKKKLVVALDTKNKLTK